MKLQPMVHLLLGLLLSEPGKLWTREALDQRIWPDVTVTDDSLSQAVKRLRVALCDERKWEDAEHNLAWRADVYREIGFRPGELMAWAWRALVSGARGDPAAARRWSDAVREFADPALGPMVATWTRLADLGPVLAAAHEADARAAARAEAAAILASAPVGPTTGQPAPTPEVRAALRLVERRATRGGQPP